MDLASIATIIGQIGALGVSVLVLVAMISERLVPKGRLDDMRRDRDACAKRVAELETLEHLAEVLDRR